ncbi:MAG: hypothetical protein HY657_01290 [Acidobacteria bacterium]|nr:hypothetical protein [Acidobacteriota bacterium]
MSDASVTSARSGKRLSRATAVALVVAAIVLVTAVLPAEYGIDPLGVGEATGLLDLYEAGASLGGPVPAVITADPAGPLVPQPSDYRVDSMSFTLAPGGSIEYKYTLDTGAAMVYTWKATGEVEFDFHTEPAGRGAAGSESFEKGRATAGHGSYRARYPGIHGWYWHNRTRDEVVVRLVTSGFYTEARQFREDGTTRAKYLDDVPMP